jgi:CHASE3 domain sensor protein
MVAELISLVALVVSILVLLYTIKSNRNAKKLQEEYKNLRSKDEGINIRRS